jgi:alpha-tubulin suppressor-like RCC1 family protein
LRCWGDNAYGQVGRGSTVPSFSPITADVEEVSSIAVGQQHACAIDIHGALRCWGDNGRNQLGVDDRLASLDPVAPSGLM